VWTTHDVEHLEYHGGLFLRSKLRQQQITVGGSPSVAHQYHIVVEPAHGLKLSHTRHTGR
jgi:hypothetical protein